MDTQMKVAILLPTFNGEKYLAAQLDSLFAQSHSNFIIVHRDDNSSDGTVSLIDSYRNCNPERLYTIDNNGENLGVCGSFSLLMQYVLDHKSELGLLQAYMMFCDQDDIWVNDKISIQAHAMLEAESNNPELPILVHSDLQVVSQAGQLISESFMHYQGLNAERNAFSNLLVSNLVTGCTALINESLVTRSLPIPNKAIMHDWWIALVGSAFGKSVYINRALVLYRQHESNTLGAKLYIKRNYSGRELVKKTITMKSNPLLEDCATQAKLFRECYRGELTVANRRSIFLAEKMSVPIGILQQLIFKLLRRL